MATKTSETGNYINIPKSGNSDSIYPYNHVTTTVGGHEFEVDDTLGNERIKRMHASGSYEEFLPDGSRVVTVIGDDYDITIENKQMTVNGQLNIYVNGQCNITSNDNMNLNCHGDMNVNVAGNRKTRIAGNDFLEVTGDVGINTEMNYKLITNGDVEEKIKGKYRQEVFRDVSITWSGDKNLVWCAQNLQQIIGTSYFIVCPEVDLRGGRDLAAAAELGPDGVPLGPGGVNLSSASGMTFGTAQDNLINIQSGNLNMVLGSFNVELGSITTGLGEICARSAAGGVPLSTHFHVPEVLPIPIGCDALPFDLNQGEDWFAAVLG